ncbi:hypothetical protein DPMN_116322 [Dreissena polymorpha]|uniref:Uncharacterized protein n=1 Tax=Dreissena polymorpha TaxID=45954 RepID=A0A9D4QTU8_DREPO|nr:hypothetical protein DPMN_116322 [Dreissena polymorpha]
MLLSTDDVRDSSGDTAVSIPSTTAVTSMLYWNHIFVLHPVELSLTWKFQSKELDKPANLSIVVSRQQNGGKGLKVIAEYSIWKNCRALPSVYNMPVFTSLLIEKKHNVLCLGPLYS